MSPMNANKAAGLIVFKRPNSSAALKLVGEVAAAARKRDDLRAGALRLQKIGGEIRRGERYAHSAYYLPSIGGDDACGRVGQLCAEGVVGGKKNLVFPPSPRIAVAVPMPSAVVSWT